MDREEGSIPSACTKKKSEITMYKPQVGDWVRVNCPGFCRHGEEGLVECFGQGSAIVLFDRKVGQFKLQLAGITFENLEFIESWL